MNYDKAIFFKSNPLPMWIFEVNSFRFIDVNAAAEQLYGYSREEFLSMKITDLFPREDVVKFRDHFNHVTYGIDNVGIWRHKTKVNTIINVDVMAETYEQDEQVYRINIIRDVTNKVNLKKVHELSINQLKYHLKNAPLLYIEWDENIRIKNFSREIMDKYGFSYNDFYHKTPLNLRGIMVRDKDKKEISRRVVELKSTGHTRTKFDLQFYDANHNIIYTEWHNSILRDENNKVVSILSLINDVTQHTKAELELKSHNELIEAVIKSLPGIFYMFDENGRYIQWNKNFEELLGLTTEEFKQENLLDHYDKQDRKLIKEKLGEVFDKGYTEFTAQILAADGSRPTYFLTGIICLFKGKKYVVGNGYNVTKQMQAEKELKNSLHTKEVLLSEVHHRVKNNLAVISGLLELETEQVQKYEVKKILRESILRIQSMALIHEKLYQSEELSRIPMRNYIFELVHVIIDTMALDIEINLKTEVENVLMNVNQAVPMALILNELVTNSLKHAYPDRDNGELGISLKRKKGNFILEVYDDGVGTDYDYKNARTLGLKLIDTLSKQLDANLTIRNNKGTHVHLVFPANHKIGNTVSFFY